MTPLECDACYACRECGLTTCRDETPSPCEDHRVCADCADTSDCHRDHADELLREALRDWGNDPKRDIA